MSKPTVLHIFFPTNGNCNTCFQPGDERKAPLWLLFFFLVIVLFIPHLLLLQEFAAPFRAHDMERSPRNLIQEDLGRNVDEEKQPMQYTPGY